tara:strand:+ start:1146 stop:1943 length:798 start_codon:yes stop_codon:yes gene_type:complete
VFEIQYIIIGLVQGITEFLPISSSGHLILISVLTEWEDQGIFTDIAVHVGTLGAVIIYLRKYIKKIFVDFFSFKPNYFAINHLWGIKILVATIPALVVGFFIYEYLIDYMRNIIVIAWSSIIFGFILFLADRKKHSTKNWEDLSFWEVFIVGIFQVLAFIPGASRAGVTITGARILNIKRESAAVFSMLLSIPIIIASLALALIDTYTFNYNEINLNGPLVATTVSFITALISIHFMMKVLKFTNFNIFIIYRILLGIALLMIYA